jgi:hypothetical protein
VPTGDGVPDVIGKELDRLAESIEATTNELRLVISAVSTTLAPAAATWNEHVRATSASITAALAALGIADAAELTRIQNSIAELEAELSSLADEKTTLARFEAERTTLLERLGDVARRKSRTVEDAARTLNKRLAGRAEPVNKNETVGS